MKCCGKELPEGVPYVLIRYWCAECNTEHLVNSVELTEYIGKLHSSVRQTGVNNGVVSGLPDIL
jgi:hypothetical protein